MNSLQIETVHYFITPILVPQSDFKIVVPIRMQLRKSTLNTRYDLFPQPHPPPIATGGDRIPANSTCAIMQICWIAIKGVAWFEWRMLRSRISFHFNAKGLCLQYQSERLFQIFRCIVPNCPLLGDTKQSRQRASTHDRDPLLILCLRW